MKGTNAKRIKWTMAIEKIGFGCAHDTTQYDMTQPKPKPKPKPNENKRNKKNERKEKKKVYSLRFHSPHAY